VLRAAPENLAANRELAGIYRRRGNPREGLARYRAALSLAPNDPELQHVVAALSLEVGAVSPAEVNAPAPAARVNVELGRTVRTIAALEQFLAAARLAP
jgi:predicted Zn-dependent protease